MEFGPTEEQQAVGELFSRFFDRECPAERVRAAEPLGFDSELWKQLGATEALGVALPEAAGGAGYGLAEIGLAAEAQGARLAPVPLVEAVVATRLLARAGATDLVAEALTGSPLVTVALRPAEDGVCRLVPAGAVADIVIGLDGDDLVACRSAAPGAGSGGAPANLGSMPVADRRLDRGAADGVHRRVLASGPAAIEAFRAAERDWLVLTAHALVGVGQGGLDLGVAYVKERKQFGVIIGSFQTIAHRLADVTTLVDGARLLARHAAWAADHDDPQAGELALMAFANAADAAQRATAESLHFHGGYGFMVEYDVQLYFRRAKAWALVYDDPRRVLRAVGAGLAGTPVDFDALSALDRRSGAGADGFRAEALAFVNEHLTPEVIDRAYRTGTMHDWGLHRALAAKGWVAASWPPEDGGEGRSTFDMLVLLDLLSRRGAPIDSWTTTMSGASCVREKGSPEQRREVVAAIGRGEALLALGFSEPDSGSDVAAASTRAVRDGDEWVINGQKVFTTMAHEARWVLLLTRTNPDVPKHRGLTMFLVPLDAPGIEIQPVHTVGWERTNMTFYTDVRIPDSARVGEVDGGWDVILASLAYERGSAFGAANSFLGFARLVIDGALDWAQSRNRDGRLLADDPSVRERFGKVATDYEVARLLCYRSIWVAEQGVQPDIEAAEAKLFSTESLQRTCADLLDLLGPDGLYQHPDPRAPAHGELEHAFRHAAVTTIYGGSSEVMRNIIAGRGLGLPRT